MAPTKKITTTQRKPGAQPRNLNAIKHGFYSRVFRPMETGDLQAALGDGLLDEVALLRVIMRRVFELANSADEQDLDTWSRSLNTLGAAATRLASLLRTNVILSGGGGPDAVDVIAESLGAISRELAYTKPPGN